MNITLPARDLRPGGRFLTPGGRELTVRSVRAYPMAAYGSVEIGTVETYLPGESLVAGGGYPLTVTHKARRD
jgi:hypothetical protein